MVLGLGNYILNRKSLAGLIVCYSLVASSVGAETSGSRGNFFPTNSARSVFEQVPVIMPAQELEHFPRNTLSAVEEPQPEQVAKKTISREDFVSEQTEAEGDTQNSALNQDPKQKQKTSAREDLLKKFGNPDEDAAFHIQDNAPKPFQAMMLAMESGDEELAYQYGKQYARHMRNLKERSQRVASLVDVALKAEGLAAQDVESGSELAEHRELLIKDLEARKVDSKSTELDQKTLDLLRRIEAEELQLENTAQTGASKTKQNQAKTREYYASRVPVDPQGKVKVFFIFKIDDIRTHAMARAVDKIHAEIKDRSKVKVFGASLSPVSQSSILTFRAASQTAFPIADGRALAASLNVKRAPAVVFIAETINKAFIEENPLAPETLGEIISIMSGEFKGKSI